MQPIKAFVAHSFAVEDTTVLIAPDADPTYLMWIADAADTIHVLERKAGADPQFYALERL